MNNQIDYTFWWSVRELLSDLNYCFLFFLLFSFIFEEKNGTAQKKIKNSGKKKTSEKN